MKIKPLSLTTLLFLSSVGGFKAHAAPTAITIPANQQEVVGDLAEWELLKAYLREVEKRSELEIQAMQSDYKLRKLIFKESNRRWWETYKEDQRKEKINEYWKRFRDGERYAQSLVAKNPGNYCKLLLKIDLTPMKSPVEDSNMGEAFERGYKGAYPECRIANLDLFLKDTDKKVSAVEAKIKLIQVNLLTSKLNEKDTEAVYVELKKKYVEVITGHIETSKVKLEKSFTLPSTELKRLQESVTLLAQTIDCANLKSRSGTRYSCTFQVLNGASKLGLASTYRVLKGEQETGAFQPRIYFGQLFQAVAVYLKEVNPNNQVVRYLADDITVSLSKLQAESDRRIENARKLIAEDFFTQMRNLKFDTIDLNRGVFSKDVVMGIIKELLDIKPAVESYVRFDMATEYEREILEKVLAHYRDTLRLAANLKAEIKLPVRDIIVTLEDEDSSDVVTLDAIPTPPKAYLLGISQEEVREWLEILAL